MAINGVSGNINMTGQTVLSTVTDSRSLEVSPLGKLHLPNLYQPLPSGRGFYLESNVQEVEKKPYGSNQKIINSRQRVAVIC